MKIFIHNPTDFLLKEVYDLYENHIIDYYHVYCDGTIEFTGDLRIDNVKFNGSEKLAITFYHKNVEKFKFYICKSEFTYLEVRL